CGAGHACRIEPKQHIYLVARECLRLVELVVVLKFRCEELNSREVWLLVTYTRRASVKMSVILSAKHFSEFRPRLGGGQARVRCIAAMISADDSAKLSLMLGIDVDFAMAEDEDPIDIAEARATTGRSAIRLEGRVGHDI